MSVAIARAVVAMALLPTVVAAQDNCFPAKDSHEAQTFGILSVPLAFSGAGSATGGTWLGLEATSVPNVSDELATPTTCRPGKGPENTDPVDGFARLRLEIGFGAWRIDVGWIPPVRVGGMRSNLVGLAVSRRLPLGDHWVLTPRVHALIGRVRGPITCNDAALEDNTSECFEGTRSNDHWDPNIFGAEMTVARVAGGWLPHAGVGWSALRPRFQVDFTNSFGEVDRRKVEVDLQRVALFAGLSRKVGRLRITGEGYFTVGDRVAGRAVVRLPLQGGSDEALP